NYKKQKNKYNLTITQNSIVELLSHNDWYTLLIPENELICYKFSDVKRIETIVTVLLKKYVDRFYYVKQNNWESNTVGYELTEIADDSFPSEYTVTTSDLESQTWLNQVVQEIDRCKITGRLDKEMVKFPLKIFWAKEHLYNPLVSKSGNELEITITPVALNKNEMQFVQDLSKFIDLNSNQFPEVYLLRNMSIKGVDFFDNSGFFPDFILWIIKGSKQSITYINPHGMMNEEIESTKVKLERSIKSKVVFPDYIINSVIITPTPYSDMPDFGISKKEWNEANVFFMEDTKYIAKILEKIKI
ncbi:MAG: hypothetical protein LBE27_00225, partial [Deltaproteobacteria bacterium]|nr:hypothetical protein [Deltaproteobacteria bacterium]